MSDIVERLVTVAACGRLSTDDKGTLLSAADEIERLRALITEWVDAYADAQWNPIPAAHHRLHAADTALREEANR